MSEPPVNAVEARNLVKRFGSKVAVNGLDLTIRRGELLSLLGPNGAGKSTTLRILTTLLPATEGTVVISGHRIPEEKHLVKPLLGLVPQEIALYDVLTARKNLWFFGRLYGLRGPALERRVGELLASVQLSDRADEPVHTFSGGMQRRVNIAAALTHDPDWTIIEDLKARGKTLVLTTHYMEEAEALSDRVAIVDHGKLIALGTPQELIQAAGIRTALNLTVAGDGAACLAPLRALPQVKDVAANNGQVRVDAESGGRLLPQLIERLLDAGIEVRSVEVVVPNLGAVFLHYTGRGLRE